jgi:hypothetical protein
MIFTPDDSLVSRYGNRVFALRPVVQCITNIVTVNDCANALLAVGASPTMAHHPEEMADFAAITDALVLNMGATESIEAMRIAGKAASSLGHPIIIDPVGCAGSPWRRSVVAASFPAKEAAAAAVALRNYCVEEMRVISKDERIASPNPVVYNHAKPKAKTGKGKAVRATPSVLPVAV